MSTPPVARSGRTLLASILFVDLVGFSRTTVTEQIEVKRALTSMLRKTLSVDPMAYGVKATRRVLDTIASYVHAQGLTDRVVKIEELFAPATLDL